MCHYNKNKIPLATGSMILSPSSSGGHCLMMLIKGNLSS